MKAENNRISELIVRVQSGDKSAFEELYKLTSPKAYFVALKICKNEHDAEDILQESYIKALEKIDTVDPEGNFTAWLYQIVANRSKNLIKAKKPLLFSGEEEEAIGSLPDGDLSFSPEEKVDHEELRSEVMAAVDELTAEKRACVMMMYFADMSVSEIAQSLEVPVSTVKNRLFTARKDLKNKFEKKGITALYSAAPLGVVIWALGKSGETTAAAFAASASSAAVLTGIGASSAATTAVATATSTAAATGTGVAAKVAALSVAQKVVAGVAAVSVIGGGATGVVTVVKNNMPEETTSYIEEVTTAPSQSEELAFAVIPTEESTTETTTEISEPTATTSESANKETTKRAQTSTTERITSTSKTTAKATTTKKPTTTQKATTTKNQTTTTKPTTQPETELTTAEETTTQPTTTEPATQVPATVTVEVMDMDENIVDTLTLSVPAGTEMTWEYLVSLVSDNGYEAKAGVYGDAVGAVAESGRSYSITAEL